jgi:type IV pilus assembly protein PilN
MIKVNLLRDQTAHVRKTFVKPTVSRTGLIFVAIFVLAVVAMGGWYLYLNRQVAQGIAKRDDLRRQEDRLKELKQKIAEFEKLKQLRQNRIDVIEKLKQDQTGPVLLLNTVIQSIPTDGLLWLTSLSQKGDRVTIVGFTQHTEMIPDLMSNLTASGIFSSVDLELMESQKDASKFSLICSSKTKTQAE